MLTTFIYKYFLIFGAMTLLFQGCSKKSSDDEFQNIIGDASLTISVKGIEEVIGINVAEKMASNTRGQYSEDLSGGSNVKMVTNTDFDALLSVELNEGRFTPPTEKIASSKNKLANLQNTNTKPMVQGVKYRLIIRQKSNGHLVYNDIMTSGADFKIDVIKGQTYEWVAYSYNNETNPPAPSSANLAIATIVTGEGEDLLHAAGEIVVSNPSNPSGPVVMPLGIVFKHQLRRVAVELNTMGMFADLLEAELELNDDYFRKGIMNVWTGAVTDQQIITGRRTHTVLKSVEGHNFNDRRAFYFYTTKTDDINNFRVNLKRFKIALDEPGLTREFTSPVTYTFAKLPAGALGRSVSAKIDLLESALTVKGVRVARSNLYYQAGHNPFRFGHMNRETSNSNSYFSFKALYPENVKQDRVGGDPCMMVYPEKTWRYPTPEELSLLVTATIDHSVARKITFAPDVPSVNSKYPDAKLTFPLNGVYDPLLNLGLVELGWPVHKSVGTRFEIWSAERFLDLGWLVSLGSYSMKGTTKDPVLLGTSTNVIRETAVLKEINLLGIKLLSGGFKNVRCVRND